MTATCTFEVFTSLDGSGYWGKQGSEFLDHRLAAYDGEQPAFAAQKLPGMVRKVWFEPPTFR